jgi:hypothetical protein
MAIKSWRKVSIGTFGLSVLLHVCLFFLVGSWVIIQAVSPKLPPQPVDGNYTSEQVTEPPPPEPEDTPEPTPSSDPVETTQAPAQTRMPDDLVTSVAVNNSFVMPPSVGVYVPGAPIAGGQQAGSGSKVSAEVAKLTVGKIFGTEVAAKKLGVIIDVSGSAHPYLLPVLADVQKNFPDAVIILAMGCGMVDGAPAPKILDYTTAVPDPVKDSRLKKDGPEYQQWGRTSLAQINWAKTRGSKYERLFDELKARGNVYCIYGGDTGVTQYAFKELYKHQVDTIYWFADFDDAIQDNAAKKVLSDVKNRSIKVIAQNFSGDPNKKGMKCAKELTKETGGTLVVKKQ